MCVYRIKVRLEQKAWHHVWVVDLLDTRILCKRFGFHFLFAFVPLFLSLLHRNVKRKYVGWNLVCWKAAKLTCTLFWIMHTQFECSQKWWRVRFHPHFLFLWIFFALSVAIDGVDFASNVVVVADAGEQAIKITRRKVAAIYLNLVSVFEWNVIKIWIYVTKSGRQRHQRTPKQWSNENSHRYLAIETKDDSQTLFSPKQLKSHERWQHMSNGQSAMNKKPYLFLLPLNPGNMVWVFNESEIFRRWKQTTNSCDHFSHTRWVQACAHRIRSKVNRNRKVKVLLSILRRKIEEKFRETWNGTARVSKWWRGAQFECQFLLSKCNVQNVATNFSFAKCEFSRICVATMIPISWVITW